MFEHTFEFTITNANGDRTSIKAPYRLLWIMEGLRYTREGMLPKPWCDFDWKHDAYVYATGLMDAGIISKKQFKAITEFLKGNGTITDVNSDTD